MQRISLVNITHNLLKNKIFPGDIAIDATVGNGYDSLFLVEQVSPSGLVFGFDIQETAIESSKNKIQQCRHPECLILIPRSHAEMTANIPLKYHGNINAIMFNLGYLPGGDKSVITNTDSTLIALNNARQILAIDGIITVMAYPGHSGGDFEAEQVKNWCNQLEKVQFKVDIIPSSADSKTAPILFVIQKLTNPNL